MNAQVTDINTRTTHRVIADVTGAQPLSHPYASQRWVPQRINVEYFIDNSGHWVAQGPHMSGVFLKSDGTPGKQQTRVDYYYDSVLPQWAVDFIAANMPALAEPRPPVPPPGVDHACCQVCGWHGLETETEVMYGNNSSTAHTIRCPTCGSTDLCYFAPSGVRRLS